MEVTDRIASLEQRVQMQEDDIQLLKSALADVVRRLNITEEQQAMQNKKGPTKARPLVQTLPLRTTVNNGTVLPKKPSGSLPSPSGTRKETVSPAAKRSVNLLNACKLKKPALSTVKRTSSAERVSPGGRRESYGDSKGSRNRTGSTSSSSSGKKNSESKPKEPMFSAGKRRVTHCKVTLQMSLTPKLLDSHENKAEPLDLPMKQQEPARSESGQTSSEVHRTPTLALPVPKSPSQTFMAFPRSPSFISPMKSPSQYFQICY
ncbi:PREDICTED: echinoderm microtubule-associated protein-like 1 [Leptosomus discolor]|uniref:echinoderm microtubule-associated protein-like 1 n=1 Tax=Leptosomus discolor TaxID=188344 RepID=UPI000522E260|nr:PREDICTED: echinoderm microtubule-associated protein-like 1 [Leptosomus discolor]